MKRSWDDFGNAHRLSDQEGRRLRWVSEAKRWAFYDGTHWVLDEDNTGVQRLSQRTIDTLVVKDDKGDIVGGEARSYSTAPRQKANGTPAPSEQAEFEAWVKKQRMAQRIDAMVKTAKSLPGLQARLTDFDQDPVLLGLQNGVLGLGAGVLKQLDPSLMIMQQAPVSFNDAAKAVKWKAFLDKVMPSPEMQAYLQRISGYSATGSIDEQALFLHYGDGSNGKVLGDTTPVPTPTGWTTHGELKPGALVFNIEGKPTKVVAVGPKVLVNLRVTFSNGEEIIAHPQHEWEIIDEEGRTRIVETQEMLHAGVKKVPGLHKAAPFRLPEKQPLDLPMSALPIDPYLLGVWLGDGNSGKAVITLGIPKQSILKEFMNAGFTVTQYADPIRFGITGGFRITLRKLGVLGNKHIPEQYLRASISQRVALLQGLLDTDGFCSKGRGQTELVQTRKELVDGISELLDSLAISHTVRESRATIDGVDKGPRWRMLFTPNFEVFRNVSHKLDRQRAGLYRNRSRNYKRLVYVTSIEPCEPVPGNCIQIADPRGVYLAGRRMTPTHNSVFLEVMTSVLGDYAQVVPQTTLLTQRHDSGIRNDLARMRGKRFLQCSETKADKRLDEEAVKSLTGGEMITGRLLYGEYFDFKPTGKIHLVTNHLPKISDAKSIWRRLHLIDWKVTLSEKEQEKGLAQKIARMEAAGVLNWILEGCLEWQRQGLNPPPESRERLAEYQEEEDEFGHFLEEAFVRDAAHFEPFQAIYNHYVSWFKTTNGDNGSRPWSKRAVSTTLKTRGFTYHRRTDTRGFFGLVPKDKMDTTWPPI